MKSYKQLLIDGQMCREHVEVWEAANGPVPDGFVVDHRDGNIHNNLLGNLRLATRAQNAMNTKRAKDNTTGLKGLTWDSTRQRWRGAVSHNRKQHNTRSHDLFEACCWIIATRLRLHGEFARIN